MLLCFYPAEGARGRYKNSKNHDKYDLLLLFTIFDGKKAPAADITKEEKQDKYTSRLFLTILIWKKAPAAGIENYQKAQTTNKLSH